ncbi:MAG: 2-amino-4-hydroxy-6-hydroxymethyldihydropteridine diphosphokinase [Phycisphaerales bacterium]
MSKLYTYAIAIGGNIGDSEAVVHAASDKIASTLLSDSITSPWYKTEPWGDEDQEWFTNGVIIGQSNVSPHYLLHKLQAIETEYGKSKETRWGARTLDLDILLIDNLVIEDDILIVPHPRLHLRNFVLYPMCDIAADWIHPILQKSMAELLQSCPDAGRIIKL